MNDYIPIPVEAAKQIAGQYQKSSVVILAYDERHEVTQTTTYGTTPFHKENAAAIGFICSQAIGCDLSKKQVFEDFHKDYDPAIYKAAMELLKKILQRDEGPIDLLLEVARLLDKAELKNG